MQATYERLDEIRTGDPFLGETDVIGLYDPDIAAAASRATLTDQGSGQWSKDD